MRRAANDSVDLAYDVEGTGPDLLLISGTASTRAIWTLVRPALARSFRTIAFDNRDSGSSSMVSAPYELEDLAADAIAVLDAAECPSAHIVGHSMGGAVAQELALLDPERCRSLTLVCSFARADQYERNCLELMRALVESVRDDRTLLASLLWAGAGTTTLSEVDLWQKTDAAMAWGALAPREALLRQWNLDRRVDTLERLPLIDVPTHVIWCTEDRLVPPPLARPLVEAIPEAVETPIEACGHLPMVDQPNDFVKAVIHFCERH
jgi:pimeloyl-ACP methyl ester carboxylesterase